MSGLDMNADLISDYTAALGDGGGGLGSGASARSATNGVSRG